MTNVQSQQGEAIPEYHINFALSTLNLVHPSNNKATIDT
jgi:hypothetical protein